LILLVVAAVALVTVVGALHGSGTTTTASRVPTVAPSTTALPLPTTTTVDPKAIQAGVAALLAHDGPTPQQVASAPSSPRSSVAHHTKSGGARTHH